MAVLPSRQRPGDVTFLVILEILLGVLFLLGVFAIAAGLRVEEVVPHVRLVPVRSFVVVLVLLVLGAFEFVLAYGLWSHMTWAWGVSLAVAVLEIVFYVFSLFLRPGFGEIASLIIDLLVLYYLMHPGVQKYFKEGQTTRS